jgi:arylsulfatase A-like enzyme
MRTARGWPRFSPLIFLLACTHANGEPVAPPAGQTRPPRIHASADSPPQDTQGKAATVSATPVGRTRVHYDLAAHAERAELRKGQALIVDFGERGDAKYTFGGWLTGTGRAQQLDGTSVLLAPEKIVKLALPAEHDGASELGLRVRGFAKGPLTVHVNGKTVAELQLSGDKLDTFTVPIPAGALARGENLLQLRVSRLGSAPRVAQAGLAIDWLWLAPAGSAQAGAPPAAAPPAPGQTPAAAAPLRIASGHGLGFALEMPAHAQLRGVARAAHEAQLSLWAVRDGSPPLALGEVAASPAGTPVAIDLGRLAGEIVRLDLRAGAADVVLEAPQIVAVEPAPARAAAPPVRNAIIVLVDTLRADKLTAYRPGSRVKTPGLHAFVQSSAVMHNARTQENWTKPSVATLLSSLLPWQHNAVDGDSKVPPSVELLPELLQKRGFYTGAFIANGYVSDKFGFGQGWHTYRNYIREGRRSIAQFLAADVLEWLDKRPHDKPFFLYVHAIDPHVPYRPPKSFLAMYDAEPYGGPVDFGKTGELLEKIKIGSLKLNARDKVRLEALYDAEISYHDVHFAAMMEGLQKRGLSENTAVIVTADHGEEFWDHGSVGHGHSVYDELLHVPLIARIPGVTDGKQQLRDAVGLVDVMPTLLEALGQEVPEHLVGRSFLPELRAEDQRAPRTAVSGFMRGWRTLGVGRLKLIQRTIDHGWLYDVADDPGETRDLAAERPLARAYARGLLGLTLAKHAGENDTVRKQRKHQSEKTDIDAQTEAQLRALGYVGSSKR